MAALLSIDEAQARVLCTAARLPAEPVPVTQALGRVLAEDLLAAGDVPPFPCSAMDGYALKAGPAAGGTVPVTGESRAGTPFSGRLAGGEAIRISTGAAVPDGADTVIRQEDVALEGEGITLSVDVGTGENVRRAGEDMRAGARVLGAGTLLGAGELAAAVAAGAATLPVSRRPTVAVLCTGDELREPGEPLGPGEIHNSNGPMLDALARRCGAVTEPFRRLADDRAATESELAEALERADVVIVSGGVSVGPHDHVKPALAKLGVVERFWGVALRPGKPTWFGELGHRLVFGLPGNPVSAGVTFSLFAAPALWALQGATPGPPLDTSAVLAVPVARNPTREQALRVRLERTAAETLARPFDRQDSHIVSSLVGAEALAMIPTGEGELAAGARVALRELVR